MVREQCAYEGGAQTQLVFGGLCITHYIISIHMDMLINYLPASKTYNLLILIIQIP